MKSYGNESKIDRAVGIAKNKGSDVPNTRQTKENSPARVMKDEGIKVKGERAPAVDDGKYGNCADMGRAIGKLSSDTERHGYSIGGHKNDPKTH